MAEPYFPGGPVPQTLDQTVDDLSRIGKGLLVGETADILGIPADLVGLYYDMRYGSTPQGIQSLIDVAGSEALAKKFMGEEFPEFGMNLESAGRLMAPGALVTKGIASARLAARMGKYPPSNGGGGFELATVGGGKLDPMNDVPETASEKLFMTRADDTGGGAARREEEQFFESDKPEIESRLNSDGTIFSNLLNELEKIGDTSSRLSIKKPIMVPKRDSNNKIIKDAAGNVVKEPGVPQIKGIDFTKKPTGRELLGYFTNNLNKEFNIVDGKPKEFSKKFGGQGLKDMDGSGLSSRLGKEAVESGLIRYLELNPDEIMTKQKVVNLASLFKPQINITAYSKSEEATLAAEIARLETDLSSVYQGNRAKQAELDVLKLKQQRYNSHNPWSYTNVQNLKVQDLTRRGGAFSEDNQNMIRNDSLTFLFSGDDGQAALMGKVVDKSSTNEVDKTINEIDDYFKAMGETTSLKELLSGSRHGYAIPNYFGHVRATAFTMKDPVTGREYKALSINEIQSNQAGQKGKALLSEDPKVTKKIQDLLDKRAKLNSEGKAMSDGEIEQLSRLAAASGRLGPYDNINTFLDEIDRGVLLDQFKPPNIMTNKTRMDALQIVKTDKTQGTGFVNLAEEKRILQEQAEKARVKADETRGELLSLNNSVQSLKRAMFRTDEKLNRDRLLVSDFKKAKAQISQDILNADSGGGVTTIDRDTNMPRFLSSLFYQNHRHTTGNFGTLAGHLPNGRGFDEYEIGRLADMTRSELGAPPENLNLEQIQQRSKARYGTQGNVDILSEVLSDKNTELADDFKLFEKPYNQAEDPGRKVIISDIDMIRDYYSDLQKGLEEGTVDPSTFNSMKKTDPDYQGYILLKKMVNGQEYFRDKDNIKKTISYLMNDRERKLEAGLFKTEVFNKVMNDPRVSEVFESDNMIELRDRLANLNKRTENMKPFVDDPMTDVAGVADEKRKILDDMLTDFGLTKTDLSGTSYFSLAMLEGRSPVADAFKDAAGEVYDEFRRTQRKIPVLSNNLYRRLNPKRISESDADVIRGTDSQERASLTEAAQAFGMGFSKFFKPKGWNVSDFNKGLSDPEAKRRQIDQIFEEYVEENFNNNATIVESAIAKRGLEQFKKDKEYIQNKLKDAEVIEQDAVVQLEDFNKERDFDAVLNKLRDKLPDDLKKSLNKIVEHQKGATALSQFQQNPPIMNYDQATELMTHSVIKKAKELGYERVVFPSMDAYDDVGQREKLRDGVKRTIYGDLEQKTSYDFAIGKPVTNALKKYGKGYSTAPEIVATKLPTSYGGVPQDGQLARIGKKQENPNAIDEDLHRIVDLTIGEASEKADSRIPRMAKGGIFSKFRKAS
jgi:hypothetical protein